MNRLRALAERGTAVWLDFLSREIINNGHLQRLIDDDGLAGITANPSIFEKAMGESDAYDDGIRALVGDGSLPVNRIYERLATADIASAADMLRPFYDRTEGRHGFVSIEVSPYLAMDTAATMVEARRLWTEVQRDNVFIKVPATPPGIPAIRDLLAEGININITLLFSQHVYEDVVEAFFAGLEKRAAKGAPINRMASVASFFVSRIDTAVDKLLDDAAAHATNAKERAALLDLRGKVAIANAKLAYRRWQKRFAGPRWESLQKLGARPQQLLWASTGTKNPDYSDVLYIDELIGPETVNTMPEKTMDAFRDHGTVRDTITADVEAADAVLAALDRAGISLDAVTTKLVIDGVQAFNDSFDKLNGVLAEKRVRFLGAAHNSQAAALPEALKKEVGKAAEDWRSHGKIRRLWDEDASLWTGRDENDWLGWLDVIDAELRDMPSLNEFAEEIRERPFKDALLLGMGGSSLGPEVLAESLGSAKGFPKLHVLDSTDPAQVAAFERKIDPAHTLFIVSSKSGTTLEPNVLMDYFFDKAAAAIGGADAGRHFVAITDPGSALERTAKAKNFHRVFYGVPSIGGRYSVLSRFGMVPFAAMGRDARAFLQSACAMARSCGDEVPPQQNPGVELGLIIGTAALRGRDKVTVIASPSIASFGAWTEQLLAESTGKHGKGVIPIGDEAVGAPAVYDAHRLFIYVRDAAHPDAAQDKAIDALEGAGQPVVRIGLKSPEMIAQEFFRFEIATAVAGALIGINPFDQPDVEASKVAARELTDAYEKSGTLAADTPVFRQNGIALYTDARNADALRQAGADSTLESWLGAHFGRIHDGDYFGVLAYVERNDAHTRTLQELRTAVRDKKRVATCMQFGPRFLHSTGQAYKGGPNSGVFLQITADPVADVQIPGRKASFGVIEAAQARGDFRVLAERGRRVLRAHLAEDIDSGLAALTKAARRALG
ncbi:MAG TPA: bifunctional transaldolase/phosoglucose isomerase [Xanthobacteraceae bacterium]|nr:bifunctional transaldolase/phosoglucose isomerase [Xanthobacteraceae bacterium]